MTRIKGIMSASVPTLKKEAKTEDAAKLLIQGDLGCVVIIENDIPIGIVTSLDFIRKNIFEGLSLREPVSKMMTSSVTSMNSNTKLDEALKIVDSKKFKRYPVVENGKLVGLVTRSNIINKISYRFKFHRSIQIIVLILFVLFELFVFTYYSKLYRYFNLGI